MGLSRFTRLVTLIFAGLRFALPAIAAVTDGERAITAAEAGVHVEASGGLNCTPPHSADCAVCRFLTTSFGRADSAGVGGSNIEVRTAAFAALGQVPAATFGSLPQPRAPPAA